MTDYLTQPSFYFHDYETFGIHPALDRPAQFAGVRTNLDLEIIEAPETIYCQLAHDYLPQPEAVLLTGITPQQTQAKGVPEYQFAQKIHQHFSQPSTCILGYNNIRFDDEVTRHLFYRNLLNPYAYSWQYNNSRWDLLDVARACCALRPNGINWPLNERGVVSFKLEHLTQENGLLHEQAHDALSDVYATIAVAKLIKTQQPKLFNYLFELRKKANLMKWIDLINMTPLVHVSGMFSAEQHHTSIVVPLAWHPQNKNAVIVCDLSQNITPLFELTPTELRERLYTKKSDLGEHELPIPIKLIHLNKCPVLAPLNTLQAEHWVRLQLDREYCYSNLQQLQKNRAVTEKLTALFALASPFESSSDIDCQLYDGFFQAPDQFLMQQLSASSAVDLAFAKPEFQDKRLAPLFFRYKARNFPEILTEAEQLLWLNQRKNKFNHLAVEQYLLQLEHLAQQYHFSAEKLALLQQLYQYCTWLLN